VGLKRRPLSLVSAIKELLERKSSGSGLENQKYGRKRSVALTKRHLSIRKKLALTLPTSGCSSVGIVRSWTKATVLLVMGQLQGLVFRYLPSPHTHSHKHTHSRLVILLQYYCQNLNLLKIIPQTRLTPPLHIFESRSLSCWKYPTHLNPTDLTLFIYLAQSAKLLAKGRLADRSEFESH
jgi:hypothetical protein